MNAAFLPASFKGHYLFTLLLLLFNYSGLFSDDCVCQSTSRERQKKKNQNDRSRKEDRHKKKNKNKSRPECVMSLYGTGLFSSHADTYSRGLSGLHRQTRSEEEVARSHLVGSIWLGLFVES